MQYLVLIYGAESQRPRDPAARAAEMPAWFAYTQALKDGGVYLGGNPLQPTTTATTISQPPGAAEPLFTDGPFAETKEQLGGYYLIDCKNLDEALAWGSKCPGIHGGKVEIRPIQSIG